MPGLIRINRVWMDPTAIEFVESYIDEKSSNQCVRVHMDNGHKHSFGVTAERFRQLVQESPRHHF